MLSSQFLAQGGRLAMVTPEIVQAAYGKTVLRFLSDPALLRSTY
ncbi:MAG: hypothetical protein R2865_12615 [Deinococcales bacterium]